MKIVSCPVVLPTRYNGELLMACLHSSLCFKKITKTTTPAFLMSNTVVLNLYGHSAAFDP